MLPSVVITTEAILGFGPLLGAATAPEKAVEIIDFGAPPVGRRGAVQCDRRGSQVHLSTNNDV